ncbi:hypothetical protein BJX65DRAFT_313583 [Aspergillus insuetus]
MSLDNISWKNPGAHNLVCFELGQRARGRVVKFRTPLPTWAAASYPEDAEFKLGNFGKGITAPLVSAESHGATEEEIIGSTEVPQSNSTKGLFPCPNKADCGKTFGSQTELNLHLSPELSN